MMMTLGGGLPAQSFGGSWAPLTAYRVVSVPSVVQAYRDTSLPCGGRLHVTAGLLWILFH